MQDSHDQKPTDQDPAEGQEGDLAIREYFRTTLTAEAEPRLPEAPEGLWDEIERRLPPAKVEQLSSRRRPIWKGLLALAASVLLGLVTYGVYRGPTSDPIDPGNGTGQTAGNGDVLRGPAPAWLGEALQSLRDQDPQVRAVAAETLGKATARIPEVREALRAALQDPDTGVRAAAAEALEALAAAEKKP